MAGPKDIREELILEKTGRSTEEWNTILDRWNAVLKGHMLTARYLRDLHKLTPWWAQAVTVRHEYARGVKK